MTILKPREYFLRVAHQFFPVYILQDTELSFGEMTLYIVLFFLAEDGKIGISQEKLACYCKASKRTIQKFLNRLEILEYIHSSIGEFGIKIYTLLKSQRVTELLEVNEIEFKNKSLYYDLERPVQDLHALCIESNICTPPVQNLRT